MRVSVLDLKKNGANGATGQYRHLGEYHSPDAFMLFLRAEWWEQWGRAIDISAPLNFPEFFTVDVTFRSSRGKTYQRFLIPTKGPDA